MPDARRRLGRDLGAGDGADPSLRAIAGAPAGSSLEPGPRTVVLAGDGAGATARGGWPRRRGWPLLAEPSSGARGGPNAIGAYRLLLDRPGSAVRSSGSSCSGTPTLSRPVTRLLARATSRSWWCRRAQAGRTRPGNAGPRARQRPRRGGRPKPGRRLTPGSEQWTAAALAAEHALDDVLRDEPSLTGPAVARSSPRHCDRGSLLGSARPARSVTWTWRCGRRHRSTTRVRGARQPRASSGIDGTVSTAVGAALAHQRAGSSPEPAVSAVALLGDLTFLHDANGLVIGPDEPRPDLTIVVVNDDGGGLFHLLEQGAPEHAASFERVFGTPHGVDLAALCAATGTPYALARTADELAARCSSARTRRHPGDRGADRPDRPARAARPDPARGRVRRWTAWQARRRDSTDAPQSGGRPAPTTTRPRTRWRRCSTTSPRTTTGSTTCCRSARTGSGDGRCSRRSTPSPASAVLDLAAGTGTSSVPFVRAGAQVVPTDFSLGMLQAGKAVRPRLPFTAGDAVPAAVRRRVVRRRRDLVRPAQRGRPGRGAARDGPRHPPGWSARGVRVQHRALGTDAPRVRDRTSTASSPRWPGRCRATPARTTTSASRSRPGRTRPRSPPGSQRPAGATWPGATSARASSRSPGPARDSSSAGKGWANPGRPCV